MDEKRYTGQQWWGLRPDGDAVGRSAEVQPVLDEDARALGEAVFERGFGPEETGTSLLLLAPIFDDGREAFITDACNAVPVNLWAKRLAEQADRRRMLISVVVDGEQVHIPRRRRLPGAGRQGGLPGGGPRRPGRPGEPRAGRVPGRRDWSPSRRSGAATRRSWSGTSA
jgi:hypothetical protein